MKKNGFIATSLLYAFFLVFISLFVVLLLNFLHNRVLVSKINENAKESLYGINNRKIPDMTVGSFVKWKNLNPTSKSNPMSENGTWIVVKTEENGDEKTVYLLSDLLTSVPSVRAALSSNGGVIAPYPVSLNVFNELNGRGEYTASLKYAETHATGMEIDIVNASLLEEISKSDSIDKAIKRNIFNSGEDYIVKVDTSYSSYGYVSPYNYNGDSMPAYYIYKNYNFNNYQKIEENELPTKQAMIQTYCGAYYDYTNDTIDYSYNSEGVNLVNPFGYVDIVEEKNVDENDNLVTNKYLDFCYFASPVEYAHAASDMVVLSDEHSSEYGDLLTNLNAYNYRLRFVMKVTVNKNANDTFVSGGKGISNDPYIITNGVKLS